MFNGYFFLAVMVAAALGGARGIYKEETAARAHDENSHSPSATPPCRPDERLDERASVICSCQRQRKAQMSRLSEQAHNWVVSVNRGCDSRASVICCWRLVLPECCC